MDIFRRMFLGDEKRSAGPQGPEEKMKWIRSVVRAEEAELPGSLRKRLRALPEEERLRRVWMYHNARRSCFGSLIPPKKYLRCSQEECRALEQAAATRVRALIEQAELEGEKKEPC